MDGNDFLAVFAATQWAAERARANLGATLIELFTYRASAHSTSDDPTRYRSSEEGALWPLGDPIDRLKQHLIGLGAWSDEKHAALEAELADEVRKAGRQAEKTGVLGASRPPVREMFEQVYQEQPWHLRRQAEEVLADIEEQARSRPPKAREA